MNSEQQLKNKSYYQIYMKEVVGKHALEVLGEKYMQERQKEVFDLTNIRFAQGEVYFLNKDYETAIFKWENISYESELYPWARKNIADAHFQMEFLAIAEDYYKEIETDILVLQMEIFLKLFHLHIRRNKLQAAEEIIQKAVELDPDYADVTKKARAFYEKEEKFQKAMELAIKEAIRTKSITWFQVIKTYIENGFVFGKEPSYFLPSLEIIYTVDKEMFEQLVVALWNYYRDTEKFFSWLIVWNEMFLHIDDKERMEWKQLNTLFKTTYLELTSGDYVMDQISEIIPKLITNGFQMTSGEEKRYYSSILTAWDEMNPFQIDRVIVEEAKDLLLESASSVSKLEDIIELFEAMTNWSKKKGIETDYRLIDKVRRQLDFNHFHVLVGGGHSFFSKEWFKSESTTLLPLDKLDQPMIQCKIPKAIDDYKNVQMIDPPELLDIQLADFIIYVINNPEELEEVIQIKDEISDRKVHFFVNEDLFTNDTLMSKIKLYFPNCYLTSFSEKIANPDLMMEKLIRSIQHDVDMKLDRTKNLLTSMRHFLPFLMDKRKEIENSLLDKIERNEEITEKLYQAIRQLHDLQDGKIQAMKHNYRLIIRELRTDIQKEIPELLKDCSNLVTIDSDFENIHVRLNEEMNLRMVRFVEDHIYQQFRQAFSEWIIESERQLEDAITSLNEISASFNYMYGEEKMAFVYDLLVLDDWKRDADRMTHGNALLEKVNILMRSASSQFFVKGAGKIFGTIPIKNKSVFFKKYQQFIENKDYSEIAKSVADRVMQQYEFFEISIERDIEMFFMNSFEILQVLLQDTEKVMEEEKQVLYEMTNQPEYYADPIKLFELHVAQLEKLTGTEKETHKM